MKNCNNCHWYRGDMYCDAKELHLIFIPDKCDEFQEKTSHKDSYKNKVRI